jgi:hypothetical protein
MNSLDKEAMYFFRAEIEKQALLAKPLIATGKIVANAAKAARNAISQYSKAMTNVAAIGNKGAPLTAKHYIGGAALGAGGIHAGSKGLSAAKKEYTDNKIPLRVINGVQEL